MKKRELYFTASKIAIENASLLYDESKILAEKGRLARGYALSVLALEESAKAFLYRCISINHIVESKTRKFLRYHENKLYQSTLILTFAILVTEKLLEIMQAIEHDKTT